ncbi:winged helix-turn-helix domain-containing protein [Oceanispirochaeta crateris]|uniref:winged helix-turn-helix domain-containing protein n=1 Tax=Oceanispirochaeta crateris TaxID=2518645 RepID=UPI00143D0377|nr:winged helix-turn-helix domain-containing protein [Oceanispirochaeta crateris]
MIQLELKERYPDWYKKCLFRNNDNLELTFTDLTLLPASVLFKNVKAFKHKIIIPFGPAEFLEQSFFAGASDYLKDPWNCQELIIRTQPFLENMRLSFGSDCIDCSHGSLRINNKLISITCSQYRLLNILMKNLNSFVNYQILANHTGTKSDRADKSIHVHIHNLKKILKEELPELYGIQLKIVNSSSKGYSLIFTCG